jgi:hypothetical protein
MDLHIRWDWMDKPPKAMPLNRKDAVTTTVSSSCATWSGSITLVTISYFIYSIHVIDGTATLRRDVTPGRRSSLLTRRNSPPYTATLLEFHITRIISKHDGRTLHTKYHYWIARNVVALMRISHLTRQITYSSTRNSTPPSTISHSIPPTLLPKSF